MIITETQKLDVEHTHDNHDESGGDLPPAYDALSIHQPDRSDNSYANFSTFSAPVAGSSRSPPADPNPARLSFPALNTNKSLPARPSPSSFVDSSSAPRSASPALVERPRARKNTSWLSLLPFASTFSAKRVRQSVISIVSDLVVPPSRVSIKEQRNAREILASLAETCAEHKLTLATILQETFITDHTPMYWAIVNYREELLVALLIHSRPLSVQTISDIRCACLVSSNQALFHALRVCRPPFHGTDGIQLQSLRTASENLLLGNRPLDQVRIQESSDRGFVVSFDILLWQSRMKTLGCVSVEFIVCGRMWSVTFFSTDPSSPVAATCGKSKKGKNTCYVMVNLLESSSPTFFDSRLVVDVPSPSTPEPIRVPRLRDARSMMLPSARDKQRSSVYDYSYNDMAHSRYSQGHSVPAASSSYSPPPTHPQRGPSLSHSVRVEAGDRKLARRIRSGDPPKTTEAPTTKPDTWSDHGVGYTSAAVAPFGEGLVSPLLCGNSRYLLPDGTLRGRLEARFTRSESSKDCVIC